VEEECLKGEVVIKELPPPDPSPCEGEGERTGDNLFDIYAYSIYY